MVAGMTHAEAAEIVRAATFAPSILNVQPWRFEASAGVAPPHVPAVTPDIAPQSAPGPGELWARGLRLHTASLWLVWFGVNFSYYGAFIWIPKLLDMSPEELAALPGVSQGRAHQVVAGALVAEACMDIFDLPALEICPWALREGVILERLDQISIVSGRR